MTAYFDWDYDTMIATEYEREGVCNKCGDCCRRVISVRTVDAEGSGQITGGKTTDGKGRWSEVCEGDKREYVKFYMPVEGEHESLYHKCSSFGDDNLCTQNGTKPWVCRVWPTAPSDIEEFPRCSYSFKEVDHWEFAADE